MRTLFRCLALLTLVALQACPEPCCAPPPPPPPPPPAVPNPPSGLVATPMSSSQINLGWADGSNNEDGFAIERCIGVACSNFAAWHTAPVDATAYIDIT